LLFIPTPHTLPIILIADLTGPHRRVSVLTASRIEFGIIPHDHWFQPAWIDEEKAKASRGKMMADNVIYGGTTTAYQSIRAFTDLSIMIDDI
jgi:hypothetical protein